MNKRTLLLSIIGCLIMVTITVFVSYAYVQSNINLTNKSSIQLYITDDFELVTNSLPEVNLNVAGAYLVEANTNSIAADFNTSLSMNLINNSNEEIACSYDVVYEWDSDSDYYVKSEGANMEFSVLVDGENETQLQSTSSTLFSGLIIANSLSSEDVSYNFKFNFYNLTGIDQSAHSGKSYKGKVKITNIDCTALVPLSNSVDYTGYYADVDRNGTIDGVIFFDYTQGADTTTGSTFLMDYDKSTRSNVQPSVTVSAVTDGLNTYSLIKVHGNQNVVIPLTTNANDRFYVIELADTKPSSGLGDAYWYFEANRDAIRGSTSTAFGSGRYNTNRVKTGWDINQYGYQNPRDMWSITFGDKFVLSKDEWSVLGSNFKKIATGTYSSMTFPSGASISFPRYYWSSSLYGQNAYFASFGSVNINTKSFTYTNSVRLAMTF